MKTGLKNFIAALLVSFAGSLPLGYLNLIGFGIYNQYGQAQAVYYVSGVLLAEAVVLYLTIHFTAKLNLKVNFSKNVKIAGIVILLLLAYWYWPQGQITAMDSNMADKILFTPMLTGLILNMVNFIQIPFWAGWNFYLGVNGYVNFAPKFRLYFIAGALTGTLTGMLLFIYLLTLVPNSILAPQFLNYLYPSVFIILAVLQVLSFMKKTAKTSSAA